MFQVRTRRSIRRKRIQRRKTSSDGRRSRVPDWQASYRCAIRYYYQVAAIPANKPSVEVLFVFFLFNARWEWMHGRIPSTATFFFGNLTILMIISKLSRKKILLYYYLCKSIFARYGRRRRLFERICHTYVKSYKNLPVISATKFSRVEWPLFFMMDVL